MGITPKYWGRQAWHFIHMVAISYPPEPTETDKQRYLTFLQVLEHILPCNICGEHFKENMEKHPPRLNSRKDFFEWTVDMHNLVNESNGKSILSYDEAEAQVMKNAKINDPDSYDFNEIKFKLNLLRNEIKSRKKIKPIR